MHIFAVHYISRVAPDRTPSLRSDPLANVAPLIRSESGTRQPVRSSVPVRAVTPQPQGLRAVSEEAARGVRDRGRAGVTQRQDAGRGMTIDNGTEPVQKQCPGGGDVSS